MNDILDYANLPLNVLLLATVVILWRKLQQREEAIQKLIERVLLTETAIKQQTTTIHALTEILRGKL
jgi:hypothetical protein